MAKKSHREREHYAIDEAEREKCRENARLARARQRDETMAA